ncbi:MAG TPA: FkbM family methyltransferase, partial [Puia sp.]|nr:FkbM family methyltransferase [Puia sp.]
MGFYKKIGLRKIGIEIISLINWVRLYGVRNGILTFYDLIIKTKGLYRIRNKKLGSFFFLRPNISDKAIFQQVFLEEQYKLITSIVTDAKYIIDAGGNVGLAARYFHIHYPGAKIISIEPDQNNIIYLQKNVNNNDLIIPVKAALWYKSGKVNISNPEESPSGFMVEERSEGNIDSFSVTDMLEQYKFPYVDILKIDIEGAEKELFENNADTWLPKVKSIIIELHDNYKQGSAKAFVNAI